MLEKIRSNIAKSGQHIYLVVGGSSPRFAYTIGVSEKAGFELILAGASFYFDDEVSKIINGASEIVRSGIDWREKRFDIEPFGGFSLQEVDASWVRKMLLGALDFYDVSDIQALQIVPDQAHWTVDVPNLARPWDTKSEPVWQWLDEEWKYPVSKHSKAVTNLGVLRGEAVTEAMRWEPDQWELFSGAGPDLPKNELREVPLGTLIGVDSTLAPIVDLEVGKGLWRDSVELKWHPWG